MELSIAYHRGSKLTRWCLVLSYYDMALRFYLDVKKGGGVTFFTLVRSFICHIFKNIEAIRMVVVSL